MSERVVVVGAGVVGLTCAVRLAEAGFETHIQARDLAVEAPSGAGCGLWLPPPNSGDREFGWAAASFTELSTLADDDRTGVTLLPGTLLSRASAAIRPGWAQWLERRAGLSLDLEEVSRPHPGYGSGWRVRVPVIEPARYLRYLLRRFEAADGMVTRTALTALPPRGTVVNATGVASHSLARDPDLSGDRVQLVAFGGEGLDQRTDRWWVDADGFDGRAPHLFGVPAGDRLLVGAAVHEGDWGNGVDPDGVQDVRSRAAAVVPGLAALPVVATPVGSVPRRSSVRLELVSGGKGSPQRRLVHCYGHGLAGYTLSWGCADEVVDVVTGLQQPLF